MFSFVYVREITVRRNVVRKSLLNAFINGYLYIRSPGLHALQAAIIKLFVYVPIDRMEPFMLTKIR